MTQEIDRHKFDWLNLARKHGYSFPDERMQNFVFDLLEHASERNITPTEIAMTKSRKVMPPQLYRFDCYVGNKKMAAGVAVHASSMREAEEKARKLAFKEEAIKFESNLPCFKTRNCQICKQYEEAVAAAGEES